MTDTRSPVEPLRPRAGSLTLVFLGVVAVGLAVVTVIDGSREPAGAGPMVGLVAPEVVLEGFDGTTWRLSEHLQTDGRPVVLNLWASWCLPCREEIPELTTFAASHPDWKVVGVATNDTRPEAEELAAELQPGYLVGMDATGRIRDRYPGFGMPATFVVDATGVVRAQLEGGVTASQLASLAD